MNNIKGYAAVLAVFAAGVILGAAIVAFVKGRPMFHGGPPQPPSKERMLERISRDLELNPEQVEQLRPIFFELDDNLKALRKDGDEKVKALVEAAAAEAEKFLRGEQLERLRRLTERFKPGGPPPPPFGGPGPHHHGPPPGEPPEE